MAKKKLPLSAAERVAKAKRELEESGGRRISVNLTPHAVKRLERRVSREGGTLTSVINTALERL